MRIDTNGKTGIGQTASAATHGGAARSSDTDAAAETDAGPHVPDPELLHLAAAARQLPETRQNLLLSIAQRLSQGAYLSRSAAESSAAALLENASH